MGFLVAFTSHPELALMRQSGRNLPVAGASSCWRLRGFLHRGFSLVGVHPSIPEDDLVLLLILFHIYIYMSFLF